MSAQPREYVGTRQNLVERGRAGRAPGPSRRLGQSFSGDREARSAIVRRSQLAIDTTEMTVLGRDET